MSHKKGKKKHGNRESKLAATVLVLEILKVLVEIVAEITKNLAD